MKYCIFLILLLGQKTDCSSRLCIYDPSSQEKKFKNSLRRYDSSKDVRLNDKRPSTSLPLLTQKALQEHQKKITSRIVSQVPIYKKQNPVPPIILDQLKNEERKKWTQDPRYAQFMK